MVKRAPCGGPESRLHGRGRRGGRSCAPVEVEDRDLAAKYPAPAPNWRRTWTGGIPFLDDPPEGRKPIHTATAIEAQTSKPRRAVRTRGHFPSDGAAAKSIYIAQTATSREWARAVRQWQVVKSQRAIMFEDRFPMASSKRQRTEFRTVSTPREHPPDPHAER